MISNKTAGINLFCPSLGETQDIFFKGASFKVPLSQRGI
jgi:hypothetical protein